MKPQAFSFADHWYVFERLTYPGQRASLVVVSGPELKTFLRQKRKWRPAIETPFNSLEEARSFVDTMVGLLAIEDPNLAPFRPGGPREEKRLAALTKLESAGLLAKLSGESEHTLFLSMRQQHEHRNNTLTPKQWDFIWKFFDRVKRRQEQRQ